MAELMLVNPRARRRRSGGRKRRRMTAKQLQYFGPKRRRHRRRRRSVPTLLSANPRRRHTRRSRRLRISRLRRNPSSSGRMSMNSFVNGTLMPAGIGAIGALGVDIALGYGAPYIPAALASGLGYTATRLAGAVGVGMLASKVMGRRYGEQVTAGAVTVILYDTIKSFVMSSMPTLPMAATGVSGMGWISPALQAGAGMNGMGVYVGTDRSGMHGLGTYVGERESDYYAHY